jgi:quercetin dioxygenase-like cupin family protein
MSEVKEVIRMGQTEIRFLLEGSDTGGVNSVFEFLVAPGAKVPAPHYHDAFDELLYGVEGVLNFTVDGRLRVINPAIRALSGGVQPDPVKVAEIMQRHGLVAAP